MVVAVVGLISLIGCSNPTAGGTEAAGGKVDPNNPFVGTWEMIENDKTYGTLIFRSNGTMGGSLIPIAECTYTVADSVATIAYTAQGYNQKVGTATLTGNNTLTYSVPGTSLNLTKKQ